MLILGDIAGAITPVLHRVLVSVSIGLVTNLAIVTCMGLKRMNASYLTVARVWGRGRCGGARQTKAPRIRAVTLREAVRIPTA